MIGLDNGDKLIKGLTNQIKRSDKVFYWIKVVIFKDLIIS